MITRRKRTKPVPPEPAVLDMEKVRQAAARRTLDMSRVAAAVEARTRPETPKPELHYGLTAEDAGRRKVVPVLHKRQCSGFNHFHDFQH